VTESDRDFQVTGFTAPAEASATAARGSGELNEVDQHPAYAVLRVELTRACHQRLDQGASAEAIVDYLKERMASMVSQTMGEEADPSR
jgi:hypothetical protein